MRLLFEYITFNEGKFTIENKMQISLSQSDLRRGEKMLNFAKTPFPLNRSTMGPDIRKSS